MTMVLAVPLFVTSLVYFLKKLSNMKEGMKGGNNNDQETQEESQEATEEATEEVDALIENAEDAEEVDTENKETMKNKNLKKIRISKSD